MKLKIFVVYEEIIWSYILLILFLSTAKIESCVQGNKKIIMNSKQILVTGAADL